MSDINLSDADEGAEAPAQVADATLKPKVWRAKVVQEFTDNILIRTCLEIVEGGETLKSHEILFQVFERFHGSRELKINRPSGDPMSSCIRKSSWRSRRSRL